MTVHESRAGTPGANRGDVVENAAMEITTLWRYPVKSLRGSEVNGLDVEPWGARGDRRWAVVDDQGRKITARVAQRMLHLDADVAEDETITLRSPEGASISVPVPHDGPELDVNISRQGTAVDAGAHAASFLSEALGRAVRLVWQPDPRRRSTDPAHGGLPGEVLSLADAGPLLLTSEASLARLQDWSGEDTELSMRRFRPNVVIDGDDPFAEDHWGSVTLGAVTFRVQAPCDRCMMTTIDPDTLARGPEPLRSLEAHHAWDGTPYFGVWLGPTASGRIAIGDEVAPAA